MLISIALGAMVVAAWVYYAMCVWGANHWRATAGYPFVADGELPPVSILKPVRSYDPDQLESFASFCCLDYPRYEIVFGALDPNDPALTAVKHLVERYPDVPIRCVTGGEAYGLNRKACNLDQIARNCQHDLFVLCDSDMRVQPDYLRRIVAPFADEAVGLVTCLYRGYGAQGMASKLEALGIGADFAPSVLLANRLEGMSFALGSTIALRRSTLERLGGFRSVANALADDYLLGNGVARMGLRVVLSDYVVDDVLGHEPLREMWSRRLRWARTMRVMRTVGWAGAVTTHGVVWAAFLALYARSWWGWSFLLVTLMARCCMALYVSLRCTHDRNVWRFMPLLALNDLMAAALWIGSFTGSCVTWRGERFRVLRDGSMQQRP